MKRLISAILVLFTLFSLSVAALAYTPFTLRNGYYWGMPKEEILELAQKEGLGPNTSKGEGVVSFQNVPVGDFSTKMLLSLDDALRLDSISYGFPSVPLEQRDQLKPMYDALAQALTNVYGPYAFETLDFMVWRLPDTEIALMIYKDWSYDEAEMEQCSISYAYKVPIQNSGF